MHIYDPYCYIWLCVDFEFATTLYCNYCTIISHVILHQFDYLHSTGYRAVDIHIFYWNKCVIIQKQTLNFDLFHW